MAANLIISALCVVGTLVSNSPDETTVGHNIEPCQVIVSSVQQPEEPSGYVPSAQERQDEAKRLDEMKREGKG